MITVFDYGPSHFTRWTYYIKVGFIRHEPTQDQPFEFKTEAEAREAAIKHFNK